MDRRKFLRCSAAAIAARQLLENTALNALSPDTHPTSPVLAPWTPGYLEDHHLRHQPRQLSLPSSLPDGTTMMVDAGALYNTSPCLGEPRLLTGRRPGEWIETFIGAAWKSASLGGTPSHRYRCPRLITALHPDHLGAVPPSSMSQRRKYIPTGVADVADIVPRHRYIDPITAPDYCYPHTPPPLTSSKTIERSSPPSKNPEQK